MFNRDPACSGQINKQCIILVIFSQIYWHLPRSVVDHSCHNVILKSSYQTKHKRRSVIIKRAPSRFVHLVKFSLHFFQVHPCDTCVLIFSILNHPCFFISGLLLSLWCFSVLVNFYFPVFFNLKVIFHVAKITLNNATEFLQYWTEYTQSNMI